MRDLRRVAVAKRVHPRRSRALAIGGLFVALQLLCACYSEEVDPGVVSLGEEQSVDGFDCGAGRPGWTRASAVTPDAVPPCLVGSSGSCPSSGFVYVSGTGWCRPR